MDLRTPESDALPLNLPLGKHSAPDSRWVGISEIGPITEGGLPMDDLIASARLTFCAASDCAVPKFELSTTPVDSEGSIDIVDAANWVLTVPPQPLPLPVGLWYWLLKITDTEEVTRSIYRGTIIVTP